jgi:hypothetical protein
MTDDTKHILTLEQEMRAITEMVADAGPDGMAEDDLMAVSTPSGNSPSAPGSSSCGTPGTPACRGTATPKTSCGDWPRPRWAQPGRRRDAGPRSLRPYEPPRRSPRPPTPGTVRPLQAPPPPDPDEKRAAVRAMSRPPTRRGQAAHHPTRQRGRGGMTQPGMTGAVSAASPVGHGTLTGR